MSKKYAVFLTALFCVFVFGFGAVFFLLPDREFSEQENRYLAQFSPPTLESVQSGQFMKDFEDYVVDQLPLRDEWIQLKAESEKLLGKQENNKVYFGTDGQTLFAFYTKPGDLAQRVEYVNQLGEKADVPVYFALIPDKSYVWADRLPANAPNVDDGSTLSQAADLCGEGVTWIDLSGALSGDDAFYRTDHHWSTMGAFQGYQAIGQGLNGFFTTPAGSPTLVSDSFYGTTWSSSGAGWVEPDEMYTWVSGEGIEVTRYPEGAPVAGELYDESFLEKKEKYSMFLGGNQPLCILRNENAATDKKLLVVRDSYSDSLAPFLAQDYGEVHLLDLRYYKVSPASYAAQNGMDEILVLYSAANFGSDQDLFLMGVG